MTTFGYFEKLAWFSFIITALFVFSLGWQFQVLGQPEMAEGVYGILILYTIVIGFLVKMMTARKESIIDVKLAYLARRSALRLTILSRE